MKPIFFFFFFSSRRRHTRCLRDWSSDVCSSDLLLDFFKPDGAPLAVSPREVLRGVVERAEAMGYSPRASVEFEYFFFREEPQSARDKHRSEERRVGKECRSQRSPEHAKKKTQRR